MHAASIGWLFSLAVNGVATVAGHVAEKMAPHVKKHGAKLVPESLKKSKDGQASNLDGAKFVAASSIQGTAGLSDFWFHASSSASCNAGCAWFTTPTFLSSLQSFKYVFAFSLQVSLRSGLVWKLEQRWLGKVWPQRLWRLSSSSTFCHLSSLLLYIPILWKHVCGLCSGSSTCGVLLYLWYFRTTNLPFSFHFLFRFKGLENLINMARRKWLCGEVKGLWLLHAFLKPIILSERQASFKKTTI